MHVQLQGIVADLYEPTKTDSIQDRQLRVLLFLQEFFPEKINSQFPEPFPKSALIVEAVVTPKIC